MLKKIFLELLAIKKELHAIRICMESRPKHTGTSTVTATLDGKPVFQTDTTIVEKKVGKPMFNY